MKTRTASALLTGAMTIALAGTGMAEIKLPDQVTPKKTDKASAINVPAPIDAPRAPVQGLGAAKPDSIHFFNKDSLHGHLVSVKPDGGVTWQHTGVVKPIHFDFEGVSSVKLGLRSEGKPDDPQASVWLTNDDYLTGKLVSLDEQTLVLDTWYAGRMNIARPMLRAIRPNSSSSSIVYSGPTDLAAWTIGTQGMIRPWKLKNGTLYALQRSSIGRTIPDMPDVANLEFDVGWTGFLSFHFSFYSDNVRTQAGNFYMLQMSGNSGYLYRYTSTAGSQSLGNFSAQQHIQNAGGKAKFNLLVNKPEKSITLLINDKLVKQWVDHNNFAGLGKGILFYPQSQGGMRFSNIRVIEWDGKIPDEQLAEADLKDDIIRFANKDKVTGQVLGIADGKVSFKNAFAPLSVPIARIGEIQFSEENAERARRNKTDVRASFAGVGSVTVELKKLEDNVLTGISENFGEVSIPLHAFQMIELNIYREPIPEEEDEFSL